MVSGSGQPDLPLLESAVSAEATGFVARLLGAAALLSAALLAAGITRTRSGFEPLLVLMPAVVREAFASLPAFHNPDCLVRQHIIAPAEQVHLVEHDGLNVRHNVFVCLNGLTLSPTALGPIGPMVFKGIQLKA